MNNHSRRWSGGKLGILSIPVLPPIAQSPEVRTIVELIGVLWLDPLRPDVVAAFEVEKSTSI